MKVEQKPKPNVVVDLGDGGTVTVDELPLASTPADTDAFLITQQDGEPTKRNTFKIYSKTLRDYFSKNLILPIATSYSIGGIRVGKNLSIDPQTGVLDAPNARSATIKVGKTTTGAAGTLANVSNSGTNMDAIFDFTIPKGADGKNGIDGKSATIELGTVKTGAAGSNVEIVNTGTDQDAIFNFTIPRGDQGLKGDKGDSGKDGVAATIAVGKVFTSGAGTNAIIENKGTASQAIFDFTIPRGDKGVQGNAATIKVGKVTTGAAGTNAIIENVGTQNDAIFDFTIPRGDKGDQGTDYEGLDPIWINNNLRTIGLEWKYLDERYGQQAERPFTLITQSNEWRPDLTNYINFIAVKDIQSSLNIVLPKGDFPAGTELDIMLDTDKTVQVVGEDNDVVIDTSNKGRKIPADGTVRVVNLQPNYWIMRGAGLSRGLPFINVVQSGGGVGSYRPYTAQVGVSVSGDLPTDSIVYYCKKKDSADTPIRIVRTGMSKLVCNFEKLSGWTVYTFWATYLDGDKESDAGNYVDYRVQGEVPDAPTNIRLFKSRGNLAIIDMDIAKEPRTELMQCLIGASPEWRDMQFDDLNKMWAIAPPFGGKQMTKFRGVNSFGKGVESAPVEIDFDRGMTPVIVRMEQISNFGQFIVTWTPYETELDVDDPNTKYVWTAMIRDEQNKVIWSENGKYNFYFPQWERTSTGNQNCHLIFDVRIESYGRVGQTVSTSRYISMDALKIPNTIPLRKAEIKNGVLNVGIYRNERQVSLPTNYFVEFTPINAPFVVKRVPITIINDPYYADMASGSCEAPYKNVEYSVCMIAVNEFGESPKGNSYIVEWG